MSERRVNEWEWRNSRHRIVRVCNPIIHDYMRPTPNCSWAVSEGGYCIVADSAANLLTRTNARMLPHALSSEAMFVNRNKVKEKVIPLWREEHEDTGEGGKYNWACKSGPYNQEWEGQKCMCKSQCLLTHGKYGRCWSSEGFAHNGMPYWLGYEYNDFHRTNGGPYHRG